MPCLNCGQEHTSVACPNSTNDFCMTCGGAHGGLVCPQGSFIPSYPQYNWFPNNYDQKLDRIIELLEALLANGTLEPNLDKQPREVYESIKDKPFGFNCPECGSPHFGTSNATDWDMAVGRCHGDSCGYEWLRSDDDNLGFHFL